MAQLDSLELQITADTKKATTSIDQLAKRLNTLSASLTSFGNDKGFRKGIKNMSSAFKDISNATKGIDTSKIKALSSAINTLSGDKLDKAIQNMPKLATAINELMQSLNAGADVSQNVMAVTNSVTALVTACSKLSSTKTKLNTGTTGSTGSTEKTTLGGAEVEEATNDMQKLDDKTKDTGKDGSSSFAEFMSEVVSVIAAIKGAIAIVKKFGRTLMGLYKPGIKYLQTIWGYTKKIANKIGSFISSKNPFNKGFDFNKLFKNILKYGFGVRSVYVLFRKLRSAIVDAYDRLVLFDSETNKAISNIRSSAKYLANSVAAAFSPLIKVVEPYITRFITKIADAMNVFGEFIATITGKKWVKAKYNYDDYAESIDDATESTEKLNAQLQGFDKLNNLTTSSSSSSSSDDDVSGYFEDMGSGNSPFAEMIKNAWEKADFTDLGSIIGAKLLSSCNDATEWLKTEGYAFGTKLGKSLATLINGFAETGQGSTGSDNLGYSIGNLIGTAIKTVFDSLDSFITNVHWESIGEFIGNGLNGFNDSNWMRSVAKTIGNALQGAFDLLEGFNDSFNWDGLKDALNESLNNFFEEIDFKKAGVQVGTLAKNLVDFISDTIGSKDFWDEVAKSSYDFSRKLIETFSEVDENGESGWTKAGDSLFNIIDGIFNSFYMALHSDYDDLVSGMSDFVDHLQITKLADDIALFGWDLIKLIFNVAWESLSTKLLEFDTWFWGDGGWAGVRQDLKDAWDKSDVGKFFNGEISFWELIFNSEDAGTPKSHRDSKTGNDFDFSIGFLNGTTKEDVQQWFEDIKGWFGDKALKISSALSTAKDTVASWWTDKISPWFGDKTLKISTALSTVKSTVTSWWTDKVKTWWGSRSFSVGLKFPSKDTVQKKIKDIVNAIIEKINSMASKINSAFKITMPKNAVTKALGISGKTYQLFKIPTIATIKKDGGFVPDGLSGQLFLAREPGNPELVGNIGGHTAVANNDQIVAAVSQGVYSAVTSALKSGSFSTNVYLEGDAQGVFNMVRKQDKQYNSVNGHSAFAY